VNYIQRFVGALQPASEHGLEGDALVDVVTSRMKEFLPTEDLLFLLRLSVEPMRNRLTLATRQGEVQL
jgi:hypothetical protein